MVGLNLGSNVVSGSIALLTARVGRILLSLVLYVVAARGLPTTGFSDFMIVLSVAAPLSIALTLGMNRTLSRSLSMEADRGQLSGSELLSAACMVCLAGFGVIAVAGWLATRVGSGWEADSWILRKLGSLGLPALLWALGMAWSNVVGQALIAWRRRVLAALFEGLGGGPLLVIVALAALMIQGRGQAYLSTILVSAIAVAVAGGVFSVTVIACSVAAERRRGWGVGAGRPALLSLRIPNAAYKSVMAGAGLGTVAQIGLHVANDVDFWVVSILMASPVPALYVSAKRLASQLTMPATVLASAVLPNMAEFYRKLSPKDVSKLLGICAWLGFLVMLPGAFVMVVWPGPLLGLLFGSKFALAAPILLGLAIGCGGRAFLGPGLDALMMSGRYGAAASSALLDIVLAAAITLVVATHSRSGEGLALLGVIPIVAALVDLSMAWWCTGARVWARPDHPLATVARLGTYR